MDIGLIDVDCHAAVKKWGATVYPNLALCKIAAYHRAKGDHVEWATMFTHYDILYAARIFNFSQDDQFAYDADQVIRGGTGYDVTSKLPEEIDRTRPDYSIYPSVPDDVAYGFLTRGCPNHCHWCVVPRKEGDIRPYMDVDDIATPTRRKLILMDNNILAAGNYCTEQLRKIIDRGYSVDFNQALDARLVNEENARLLAKIRWTENRIRFGCDTTAQIAECERAIDLINSFGYRGEYFLYTMLHGTFDECFHRINHWWLRLQENRKRRSGGDVYPYAQPYRDPLHRNEPPMWQRDMAQWVNKKMLFLKVAFRDFSPRKGFTCNEYFNRFTNQ